MKTPSSTLGHLRPFLGRLRVDLITWVEKCSSIRMYVHPQKIAKIASIFVKFGM